jgi:glycosyltransferase involved in cell wall biosynthesis
MLPFQELFPSRQRRLSVHGGYIAVGTRNFTNLAFGSIRLRARRMTKVSVIMPAFNAERFIGMAVHSVLHQTFEDWELIVIDDGSSDATPEILGRLTDTRIRVIRQMNGGEANARNAGLHAAIGQYIAFLDADDLYLPGALQEMSSFLDENPSADALFSDGYFCDGNAHLLGRLSDVRPGPYTGHILEPLVIDPAVIAQVGCTMIRNSIIRSSGVHFDTSLVIGPDWDFWIHLALKAQFGYLDRFTCMYRVHQANITVTSGPTRRNADLVRGRLKVIRSNWYSDLSPATQEKLFYQLLIGFLDQSVTEQREILAEPAFVGLPAERKARLLRIVATKYLLNGNEREFALDCLREAARLSPTEYKNRLLVNMAEYCPPAAAALLRTRSLIEKSRWWMRRCRHQVPGSVPAALAPTRN